VISSLEVKPWKIPWLKMDATWLPCVRCECLGVLVEDGLSDYPVGNVAGHWDIAYRINGRL
jgi:hypothetical protein